MPNPKKDPPASSTSRPPQPGEPGSPENPIRLASFEDIQPGSKLLGLTLGGVTLWKQGETLTPEERERRMDRALIELHKQKGWPPPPSKPRGYHYVGHDSAEAGPTSEAGDKSRKP